MLPTVKPGRIYTDSSLEFVKACAEPAWTRPQTNGITGRAVRGVKEGTATVLVQSGLSEEWWDGAMECYCHLRNICGTTADGTTILSSRVFSIPFVAKVVCKTINPKNEGSPSPSKLGARNVSTLTNTD